MKQKIILLISLFIVFVSCDKDDASKELDKEQLLALVNESRASGCDCGSTFYPAVGKLVWNEQLEQAAKTHSQDMNNKDKLTHTGSNGSSPGDRITDTGYVWTTYGENIAWNYSSEAQVIQGWLDSEGHCQNIMNANVTEMGVALEGKYWTQVFANAQ